ncbi:peptidoglycan DD-metalloendopeptidase family protein [Herbaspirillum sp. RTI4]|nr:peptidoglycan DD-metalloendopeptidase family protein [Herbaspirillum sp. RTI4]MDY7578602.1 peptidoglycan DD-metalloendopeptidase family protein [Herbaspirillum sp. RTI4]MEA9981092.1 peptidoglycan DD-metalloendopeptidase family protein [Herbaspirillum sp. RTI4]
MSLLAACTTTPRIAAPVIDRNAAPNPDASKSSAASGESRLANSPGYYTVKKGDSLLRIAVQFGQSYRDLVAWNNLNNPNDIKVDQVLRVMPPDAGAPQTAAVSVAASGVEVKQLGAQNSAAAASVNKTGPRGDKRPYSESTLAELEKPDAAPSAAPAPVSVKPEIAPQPADKTSQEEAPVTWIWPTDGKVVGTYASGKKGLDIAGKEGQAIMAAGDGKVMYAGSGIRGYGNLVIIKHTNNVLSAYAHNKTILVKEGQMVTKGQKIAEMGKSDSDSVKLHFEIRQQGKPVDPSRFLPAQ